ncbi:hypothetical protein ACJIZ3_009072 [Penstemon smallii]|uniref:Nucleolar pre-ribosomal-associated protein 1 C-terminal domain-containing protein n=1 Tax=Penstemon smallii TaxID=265156 RepID=A0ABD3TBI5_9LAMI
MKYKSNDESKIFGLFRNLPSVNLQLFLPETTIEVNNEELTNKFNKEAKLKELIGNLNSNELQIYSDASKEIIKVLKSDKGSEFIHAYLQTSSNLVEISQAGNFAKVNLHCNSSSVGDNYDNSSVKYCELLDKFARGLIEEEKMRDLYKELKSKVGKGRMLCFYCWHRFLLKGKGSSSTRKAFVGFAMAFLEVGNPRLLRVILQQKDMYSGVLRGLGNDDEETVIYVLSVLRDKVLVPESLVPPGHRSVLFGSVTLEKQVGISGRDDFGDAAELAHSVLVMVCTNPANGLMPDMERRPSPLRGNRKHLLDLVKKLKATKVDYHKDLLLAVLTGRPSLASAFLDIASINWLECCSSVSDGISFEFVDKPPAYDSPYVQNIFKCIVPRPFTRLDISKDSLINAVNNFGHSNDQNDWASLKIEIQNGVRVLLPDPQVLLSLLSPLDSLFTSLESTTKRKAETEYLSEHNSNVSKRLKSSNANEDVDIVVVGVDSFSEVDFSGKEVADSSGEQQSENGADTVKILGRLWGLGPCSIKHMYLRDGDTCFYSKLLDTLTIFIVNITPIVVLWVCNLAVFYSPLCASTFSYLYTVTLKVFEEHRKIQFRANLPVDPKLCAQTVLCFPYFRFVSEGTLSQLQKNHSTVGQQANCTTADKMQIYDPVFILRFSIHCLSMSYIVPVEFASFGLLAIAFVSLSSPDYDMRNLGDEVLANFKTALKKCQKKKDVRQLLHLLSYLQKPSQRIPSIITIFAAEDSLVLLDPSHDNYSAISKYLKNSPRVNMNAIPLFQIFFWSSSISFRADRLWMLRLLYVGLNTEDDAQIYIRNSVFEILMNFYSSPHSDNGTKELIIQIVKKAVRVHNMVRFLVEHCGLILWLSSIVSLSWEVVKDIILPRNLVEWLPKHALEQLSELSSHLFKLLKNKIYQPHFTLSDEGLFQLYEVVDVCSKTRCNATMVLGLEAILMSSPPITILRMDQEKLLKFLRWAVTTAIQSESTKELQPEDSDYNLLAVSLKKDSLVSKLLRWLTASVTLGCKISKLKSSSFLERPTLQSLLEFHEEGFGENAGYDILAVSIIYLLQLLGFSHGFLPSVVSALCLLLLSGSSVSESEFLVGLGSSLPLLCSKIRCPAKANPAWRWSFYEPWRDVSSSEKLNEVEKLDEIRQSLGPQFFPLKNMDNLHVYDWEKTSMIQSDD